jgi:N-acetylglucosamine-6-phosphate deacetylase
MSVVSGATIHRLHARTLRVCHGVAVSNVTISFSVNGIISISPFTLPLDAPIHDFICSGFVDIHNHGIGGCNNVQEYWLHDETMCA